jgi:hypothetical protein
MGVVKRGLADWRIGDFSDYFIGFMGWVTGHQARLKQGLIE